MAGSGITGLKAHTNRLKKLSSQMVVKEVGKALFIAGERIQVDAQISITAGSVSGKQHVPSKPGEPPSNDTGVLANNISTVSVAPLIVEVSSRAPYASALEFGTSKMAARPYMKPARDKNVKFVQQVVQKAVNNAIKKSRSGDS